MADQQPFLGGALPTLPGRDVVIMYAMESRTVTVRTTTTNKEAGVLETSSAVVLTHGEAAALVKGLGALLDQVRQRAQATADMARQVQAEAGGAA